MTIKRPVLVGGPLLGDRSTFTNTNIKQIANIPNDLKSWTCFEPIITPPISGEQFVLLPSATFVTVLAYNTGRRVATLVPFREEEKGKNAAIIESACLATFSTRQESQQTVTDALRKLGSDETEGLNEREQGDSQVLLIGCCDGTIREFDLSILTRAQQSSSGQEAASINCGSFDVTGDCYRPRRVFSITMNQPIKHFTFPLNVSLKNGDALVYVLAETSALKPEGGKSKHQLPSVQYSLLRVKLPPFNRNEHTNDRTIFLTTDENSDSVVVQDSLKCTVGYDKEERFQNTAPFRLLSVSTRASRSFSANQDEDRNVFVVIGRSNKFHVYHERIKSGGEATQPKMQFTSFPISDRRNPLSSISIAPNGTDVTCGYVEGDICIMTDALPQTLDYFEYLSKGKTAPPHPSSTVLNRRVHWHAHPVTSLAYQKGTGGATVDPMLYSGGNESVLVTWQLSRGTYRPADVLPRLAMGGIVHITCSNQEGGILVYCEDNSLQLFAAHNKSRLWNVQGLASSTGDSLGKSSNRVQPTIRAPSGSSNNTVILSGLPGAPGYLHWYNLQEQRVTAQLEVAPFNRVSRTENDDSPMPVPSVTHCAFSQSGCDLVTVDTMPTENSGIGATERLRNGSMIGVVSTVRFWSRNEMDNERNPKAGPYSLTAAMTFPHGEENQITAVAVSKDGQYACTVSNDDNAFRLWHKVLSENDDEQDADSKNRRTPVWVCRFKVTTPSGYSNFATGSNAVSFSSDGSILAICYGNMITLWDHKEAALLTSLQHLDDDRAPVETLSFVKTTLLNDLILTRSYSGVALQSPYGKGKESWSCALPADYTDASVTHAELIPSQNSVAICMTFHKKAESHILLVDAVTGSPLSSSDHDGRRKPMMWKLPGTIRSIGIQSKDTKLSSNWVDVSAVQETRPEKEPLPVRLYATLSNGDMIFLSTEESSRSADASVATSVRFHERAGKITNAPRLNMLKRGDGRKRKREQETSIDANVPPAKRNMANIFGASFEDEDGSESTPLPSSELPSLGGAFTRAFVSRNLASNKQNSS